MPVLFGKNIRKKKNKIFKILFILLFLFSNFNFPINKAEATTGWYNVSWGYRTKITIDRTKVPNTDQLYFPVLINRTDTNWKDTGHSGHVGQADGGDFVFTSSDGITKLSHEIESYDNVNGILIAWVNVPTLATASDTVLYLYYGYAAAADQWNITGTWNSSYKGVWHLPNGTSLTLLDSKGVNNGTNVGGTVNAGYINGGVYYDGNSHYSKYGTSNTLDPGTSNITLSFWVKYSNTNSHYEALAGKGFLAGQAGYGVYVGTVGDHAEQICAQIRTAGTAIGPCTTGTYNNGIWHYVVFSVVRSSSTGAVMYIDGSSVATADPTSINGSNLTTGAQFTTATRDLGDGSAYNFFANNYMDEVRVSIGIARSADWIKTEYNNQSSPSTFYSVAAEDTVTVPGAPTITSTIRGNAQVDLSWTAPSDGNSTITDYMIDFKLHSDSSWTNFPHTPASTATTTTVAGVGLVNGSNYDFRVKAQNGVGWGDYSTTASAIPATTPGKPTITGVTRNGSQTISVAFTAGDTGGLSITGYTIYNSVNGSTWTGTSSPINATSLTNGTSYTFTVKATNDVGQGPASDASSSITPATVPGAPTIGTATVSAGQASVAFTAGDTGGSAITGYTVYNSVNGTTWTGTSSPINATGLSPGTAYTFTVKATNDVGQGVASGSSNSVTTPTAPGVPVLTATRGSNSQEVNLSWTTPSDGGSAIDDYMIDFKLTSEPTNWTNFPHTPASTATSTTVTGVGLVNGLSYDFRVKAHNAVDWGNYSDTKSAIPATTPGKPTITGVTRNGSQTISVAFTAGDTGGLSITGYTIYNSVNGSTWTGTSSPINATGLTNGTSYTFTVKATNDVGQGPASDASTSIIPATVPGAPTTVLATAQDRQVYLSWTAPEVFGGIAISDYIIDVKLSSAPDTDWATFADGTSILTHATVNNLTNGLSYDFRVSATNAPAGPGKGDPSSPIVSSTPMTTPSAPTITGVIRGGSQEVVVSFSAPDNGGSAILYYTIYNDVNADTTNVDFPATSATVTGLTNGTSYHFTVKAKNAVGYGSASNQSEAIIPATHPDAPTNLNAVRGSGSGQVDLTWTAPATGGSAIDNYVVEYEPTSAPDTWRQFGHVASDATSIPVTDLTNGLQYEFRVSAHNVAGTGGPSSTANATPATVPSAPIINTATRGNAQVSIGFSAPTSDGGSAIIDYTVTDNTGAHTAVVNFPATSATVSGLTNGTPYTFTVKARNIVGQSVASDPSASVTPATVPGVPTAITPTVGDSHVDLSWTAPEVTGGSDITDYVIEFEPSNASNTWASVGHTASPATSIPVPNLTNGLQYEFRVSAVNDVNKGEASSPVTATPVTFPGAPTITGVVRGGSQEVVVSFSTPDNGGLAIIDYTVTSSPDSRTATVNFPATSATVSGLTNGTPYTFTVKARNAVGQGNASNPSASITPATVPGVPTTVLVTAGNAQATVSFTAPDNGGLTITGYTVTSSAGIDSNAGSINLSHLVTGLTKGATYTFSVTATNDVGTGLPAVSDPVTLPTEPGAPGNLAAIVLGSSIKLTWSAPANGGSDITGYVVEYQTTTGGTWVPFGDGTSIDATATVTGLSDRTSYDFKVSAKNIIGPGLFSDVVSATPGEPAQVRIQGFPDLTATTIGTEVLITNEGSVEYEYQYTWCVTDSEINLCGGGDDIFSATAAKLIKSHEDYDPVLNSTVLIPGNYWFHIKVLYGSESSVADQSFTAVATYPDPPISVSAVAGNTQAIITFTPPASNGGSIITGYTVTSSPGGLTGVGNTSPIIVTGLTNGTNYTFKVNAINSVGTGLASDSSASVMPVTIPDPPTSISATAGNAQVTLSWTAPMIGGGLPIIDYIIEYKFSSAPDSDWATFLDPISTTTTATVINLTNNISYDFRISAVNSFGRSGVNLASGSPANTNPPQQSGVSGSYIPNHPQPQTQTQASVNAPTTSTINISTTTSKTKVIPPIKSNKIPTKNASPTIVSPTAQTTSGAKTNKNEISAIPTAPTTFNPKINPTTPVSPTATTKTGGYWILWLLIAIFIFLIFAVLIIFIISRRRKNKQEQNYPINYK